MASHAQDDGFHEIQLNGKQLVFVFMAATVVSVVIFLCGVLVGRGVRSDRDQAPAVVDATGTSGDPVTDHRPGVTTGDRPVTVVLPGEDPTKAPPPAPPATDGESGKEAPRVATTPPASPPPSVVPETPKPKPTAPAPKPVEAAPPAREPAPKPAPAPVATTASASEGIPAADDPRQGWVVQVAATTTRVEADTMAKTLSAKGYSAFVLSNSANVFRVRVGGYKARRDAETVAAKLRKEEHVNPWVTR